MKKLIKNIALIWIVASISFLISCRGVETDDTSDNDQEYEATLVQEIGIELFADGFVAPLGIIPANDDTGRKFLFDQEGVIWIFDQDGSLLDEPFLDLRDAIVDLNAGFDERGLLGMALHPDFKDNNRLFVHYSGHLRDDAPEGWNHTGVIAEFTVSEDDINKADIDSERIVMYIDQPQSNHNGGDIVFCPDGYLYIPLGDGGGSNDTGFGHPEIGHGQDISTILGAILRIDVDGEEPYGIPSDNPFVDQDGRDEIYAYGLRNPYSISFDTMGENKLFAADVGQDLWEEINIIEKGGNYGWNIKEGTHCFDPDNPTEPPEECREVGYLGEPLIDPILEYRNARHGGIGIAVIGGFVYRGEAIPDLFGEYIFGDWSLGFAEGDGTIFAAHQDNDEWVFRELSVSGKENGRLELFVLGFGQDKDNELYILTTENSGPTGNTGQVFKLVPAE